MEEEKKTPKQPEKCYQNIEEPQSETHFIEDTSSKKFDQDRNTVVIRSAVDSANTHILPPEFLSSPGSEQPTYNPPGTCSSVGERRLTRKFTLTPILDNFAEFFPEYELISEKKIDKDNSKSMLYKVTLRDNREFALKIDTLTATNIRKKRSIYREYFILKFLCEITENVPKVYDLQDVLLESGKMIRIEVLKEYPSPSIRNFSNKMKKGDAILMSYQLVQIMALLEQFGVTHFNIKPDSLLWDEEKKKLTLSNFATALCFLRHPQKIMEPIRDCYDRLFGWTAIYAAPEFLQDFQKIDIGEALIPQKADAFSFGITFSEIILLENGKDLEIQNRVTDEENRNYVRSILEQIKKCHHFQWADVIESCLSFVPSERPTFSQLCQRFARDLGNQPEEYFLIPKPLFQAADCKEKAYSFFENQDYEHAVVYYEESLKSVSNDQADGLCNLGISYQRLGNNDQAIKNLMMASEFLQKTQPNSQRDFLKTFISLGETYIDIGQFNKTSEYCKKAENIARSALLEDSVDMGFVYIFFGLVNKSMAEYASALSNYKKAETIFIKTCGDSHYLVGNIYREIGHTHESLNQFTEALEFYTKAEQIYKQSCSDSSVEIGKTYNQMGILNATLAEYSKASEYYEKGAQEIRKAFGDDHPLIAEYFNYIGKIKVFLGDYNMAIEHYNKAIAMNKNIGYNSPVASARSLNYFGEIYLDKGDYKKALEYFLKAEEIINSTEGDKNQVKILTWINLGSAYKNLVNYAKSEENLLKAEQILIKIYGEPNASFIPFYIGLASLYNLYGKQKKAAELLQKAEQICTATFNTNHPMLGTIYKHMGDSQNLLCNYVKALEYAQKAMKIFKKFYNSHVNIGDTYITLGQAYAGKLDYDVSLEQYEKAAEIFKNIVEGGHCHLGVVYNLKGLLYLNGKGPKKSIEILRSAEEPIIKYYGTNHPELAALYDHLGEAYQKIEEYVAGLEYHQKAELIWIDTYKEYHVSLGKTYVNIAKAYHNVFEDKEALRFVKVAEEILAKRIQSQN